MKYFSIIIAFTLLCGTTMAADTSTVILERIGVSGSTIVNDVATLKAMLAQKDAELLSYEDQASKARAELATNQNQLAAAMREIDVQKASMATKDAQLKDWERQMAEANANIAALKAEAAAAKAEAELQAQESQQAAKDAETFHASNLKLGLENKALRDANQVLEADLHAARDAFKQCSENAEIVKAETASHIKWIQTTLQQYFKPLRVVFGGDMTFMEFVKTGAKMINMEPGQLDNYAGAGAAVPLSSVQ